MVRRKRQAARGHGGIREDPQGIYTPSHFSDIFPETDAPSGRPTHSKSQWLTTESHRPVQGSMAQSRTLKPLQGRDRSLPHPGKTLKTGDPLMGGAEHSSQLYDRDVLRPIDGQGQSSPLVLVPHNPIGYLKEGRKDSLQYPSVPFSALQYPTVPTIPSLPPLQGNQRVPSEGSVCLLCHP